MSKIFVRFTQESIDSIYRGKEITRDDGSKVRLFIAVDAPEDAEKRSVLFVQTAIVEAVSEDVTDIKKGDIAIVNYDLFNSQLNFIDKDDNGSIYWLDPETTYHDSNLTAYADRRSSRDQIVYQKGDYDKISFLLGIIRNDVLIARKPFIFLEPESNIIKGVTLSGIIYEEKQRVFTRRVLSSEHKKIKASDRILVYDNDIFEVRLNDKIVNCICDIDVIAKVVEGQKYPVPL